MPVLTYPDTSKPYIFYTETSDDCIGACLCQEQYTPVEMKPYEKTIHYLSYNLQLHRQIGQQLKKKKAFAIFYAL